MVLTFAALPTFDHRTFVYEQQGDNLLLSWHPINGFVTQVLVEQCIEGGRCITHDVAVNGLGLRVRTVDGFELALVVIQGQDETIRVTFTPSKGESSSNSHQKG